MATFTLRRMVEYADTDMAGIVHFTAYFRYLEAAEHAFLRARGIALSEPPGPGRLGFPRVASAFDYRAPLRFDDEFEVRLRVTRIGRSSVTYRADIVRGGEVVAVGRSTCACCRMDARGRIRAVSIPKAMRKALTA